MQPALPAHRSFLLPDKGTSSYPERDLQGLVSILPPAYNGHSGGHYEIRNGQRVQRSSNEVSP